jgi:phage-related tail fiber protein
MQATVIESDKDSVPVYVTRGSESDSRIGLFDIPFARQYESRVLWMRTARPTMSSQLLQLAKLITEAVSSIDRKFSEESLLFPSLNSTEEATPAQVALTREKSVAGATALAIAAAAQLIATVRQPKETVMDIAEKASLGSTLFAHHSDASSFTIALNFCMPINR